jgi:hypothetical protein
MNHYVVKNLSLTYRIWSHFQARKGLGDWGEDDGKSTAEILVVKTDEEKQHGKGETNVEARVRAMMETHAGLKELGEKYEWFEALLAKVIANKLRPAGDSKAKLCNMSVKEARVIGRALASCIAANLTAPAAVDEWILRYPAMGELDREYVHERERSERKHDLAGAARQQKTPATDAGAGECTNDRHRQPPSLALASLARRTNSFLCARFARPTPPLPPPPRFSLP